MYAKIFENLTSMCIGLYSKFPKLAVVLMNFATQNYNHENRKVKVSYLLCKPFICCNIYIEYDSYSSKTSIIPNYPIVVPSMYYTYIDMDPSQISHGPSRY